MPVQKRRLNTLREQALANKPKLLGCLILSILFFCLSFLPLYAGQATQTPPRVVKQYLFSLNVLSGQKINLPSSCYQTGGWRNIKSVYILIAESAEVTTGAVYAYYDVLSKRSYLRDDSNANWLTFPAAAENRLSVLYIGNVYSAPSSSNTLIVNWLFAFKDSFTGAKNIYVKAVNTYGQSSAWQLIGSCQIRSKGVLIGPAGGEVTSPDNKAKLIIPKGALNQLIPISVTCLDKDTKILKHSASANLSGLIGLVELRPAGLRFASGKPATLVYRLDKPEVPGTHMRLGLYNGKTLAFTQTSPVNSDNYTVNFPIQHFSIYAALKGLTPTGPPIGMGVKIPLPDMFTGAFSHSVPITVAPGRKGIQPSISLTYRSSNPNSWTGVGFSLNPGYITRSTRLGPPTYNDTQDTFYFISDAGTTELVHLVDNLYQARIESSFTKFFKESDDSWQVVGKDGSVMRFGQTPDSKEGSASGTFSWYITKAQDTNANYIQYSYIKDQDKSYLSRIDYTGNENAGTSPTNSVEFFCQPRTDISSSYITGSKIVTAKLLTSIESKVKGELVWRYELKYAKSPDTNRSLLESITQYSSDNKSLPSQTFSYQEAKK